MHIVVFITAKDKEEAKNIARHLVEARLAACVNILDGVESIFWWEGKMDGAPEALLIVKSKKDLLKKIIKLVKSVHSYAVPEIIALPIVGGSDDYLKWIDQSVGKDK
ncbi:MAG: divalent-cation tolerance protein CutA [Candidatus Omnitrophota bacterium]